MAKAKFFLPENRNAQVDEANALPSDIYFPANINRTESRTTTPNNPGTFTNNIPNNSVSLSSWLNQYRQADNVAFAVITGEVIDNNNAATTGVALYVHVDENVHYAIPTAHLEFVSPTNANGSFQVGAAANVVRVKDDDAAATGGFQLYFDEDAADADSRLMINNTATGQPVFIFLPNGDAIRIAHNANAATAGVAVYFDEDATTATKRLLFVSPTNDDGTFTTDDNISLNAETTARLLLSALVSANLMASA